MSRRQRLIIFILAIGDILVFLALGAAVLYGSLTRAPAPAGPSRTITTPLPSPTPTLPPTWTPAPTPTPQAYIRPSPTPRPPTEGEAPILDEVERQVVQLRELELLRPVRRWVLNETQLGLRIADQYDDGEELGKVGSALVALDWIGPDADLGRLWQGLMNEQIAAFYDARDEAIYLVSNADVSGPTERAVFAHQMVHALQDQQFGLDELGISRPDWPSPLPDDRELALRAFTEGDATLAEEQYVDEFFSEAELLTLRQEAARAPHARLDSAPRAIREMWLFPYTYGRDFVAALYAAGGWSAVDAAYASPPTSTEQILHPDRYLAGDVPLSVPPIDLSAFLGDEWHLALDGTIGEFGLRLYLENALEATQAMTATEGWGGDAFSVYVNGNTGQTLLALHTVWDDIDEGGEFWHASGAYAELRFGRPADELGEAQACWTAPEALCILWRSEHVLLVRGPERTLVEEVSQALLGD